MTQAYIALEVRFHSCVEDPEQARKDLLEYLLDRYDDCDWGDIEVKITETTP